MFRVEVCTGPFFQARPGPARPSLSPARPVFVSSVVGPGRPGSIQARPGPLCRRPGPARPVFSVAGTLAGKQKNTGQKTGQKFQKYRTITGHLSRKTAHESYFLPWI
jgi:hypothetical protein